MLSTSSRGSIGELKVCIDLMKKGWTVFQPIVDDISCDLIAIKDNIIKNLRKELAQYQRDYANRNSWVEHEEEYD